MMYATSYRITKILVLFCFFFFFLQLCPGGGFGPVSDNGYGVSYMMAGDQRIFFHVSSKKSCSNTNSQGFVDHLCQALADMRMLFSGHEVLFYSILFT